MSIGTLTLDDLELARQLEALFHGAKPSWQALGQTLERDPSNVRKSAIKLEKLGLVTLDPVSLSPELADAVARQFGSAEGGKGDRPPAPMRGTDGPDGPEDRQDTGERRSPNYLPHGSIRPSPLNPRKLFREESIAELATSIGAKGMLQPILVRPVDEGRYEIAAGERRWRAVAKLIEDGLAEADAPVPVIIRPMSDIELVEIAIIENRDREDVHPLEEAEAYLTIQRLRAEEGGDPGEVTAELAERAGRTRRHIQKRIALASRLSPAVKQAFAMGDISLAQAQALSPWPHERQDDALDLIVNGRHGWQTADDINRQMRSGCLLAKHALFPLEAYDGETIEDDEGELVLTDRAQAERLQREAFEAVVTEERKAGWAAVEVHPGDQWFNAANEHLYERHLQGEHAPKAEAELHIRLDDRSLEAQAVYLVHETPAVGGVSAGSHDGGDTRSEPRTGEADAPEDRKEEIPAYTKRHWIAAASAKTTRLQTALANAPVRYAMAITVLALAPYNDFRPSDGPSLWIHGHRADGEDGKVLNGGMLAWRDRAEDLAGRPGFMANATFGAKVTNQPEALTTLVDAPELPALFAALIAAQAGSWPGYGHAPMGDSLFVRVLAGQLDDLLPRWQMDAAWLERFTLPQLARIADACIVRGDPDRDDRPGDAMPKKKAEAVKWILNHVRRDTKWTPPEMHFDDAAALDAAVAAMLEGVARNPDAQHPQGRPPARSEGRSEARTGSEDRPSGCEGGQE